MSKVERTEETRPDFEGFIRALRDEASWVETIKTPLNGAQGQTDSDATALRRLADKAQRLGINQGYLTEKVK